VPLQPATEDPLAERLFNAYGNEGPNPWKTWNGQDQPRWPDLMRGERPADAQVVAKWRAAARAAQAFFATKTVSAVGTPAPVQDGGD